MNILMAVLWFAVISAAVTICLPRILDALLLYYDNRAKQLTEEYRIQERKLEVMREQVALQQRKRQ